LQQETDVSALPRADFLNDHGQFRGLRCAISIVTLLFAVLLMGTVCAAQEVELGRDVTKLPAEVQRMRLAILQAVWSGDIEQLRGAIEMNEIHPIFGKGHIADPIGYLKSTSADGNGREVLAILYNVLTTGYAITNPGAKDEMIVWPYHAVVPLDRLTPAQEVEIYRFLPPTRVREMAARGKYSFYRVGIGHDGVWHYFSSE
jgi:hypothetical protein